MLYYQNSFLTLGKRTFPYSTTQPLPFEHSEKTIELELYAWQMEFFQSSHCNSWSRLSKNIPNTSPSMLKNLYYSHAISSLKRIASLKPFDKMDSMEALRVTVFLIIAKVNLAEPIKYFSKSNHFYKLLNSMGITLKVVEDYISKNNINASVECTRSQLFKHLCPESETNDNSVSSAESMMRLPIDKSRKLAPLMRGFKRLNSINSNDIKESAFALVASFNQCAKADSLLLRYNTLKLL